VLRKCHVSSTLPDIFGNFTFHVHFWNQEHIKFPEIMGNFTYPINFPTEGHVTFPGHLYEY